MPSDGSSSKRTSGPRARRASLYARPTRITHTQTTVDREIDRLWLRVQLRAAELGITQKQIAEQMGISPPRLTNLLAKRTLTRAMFQRLCKVLGGDAWTFVPLHVPRVSLAKMKAAVRAKLR